jgi:hypothetical protein
MPLFYRIAADAVVILHMTYVLVVVLGLPAIWFGILRGHSWVRNFWWRFVHLSMILIVVGEAWAGIACPLTIWEYELRELAGQRTYTGSFVGNLVHDLLFYDLPPYFFTILYTGFGGMVLLSFLIAPPRWPEFRQKSAQS